MATNDTTEPSPKQLAALMDDYFKTSFDARHAPSTIEAARQWLPPFLEYLIKHTKDKPTPTDYRAYCQQMRILCQGYIDHMTVDKKYKYWSVHMGHKEASRFFNWCVTNGYLLVNPMKSTRKPPRSTTRKLLFTHDEYLKLLKVLEGHPVKTLFIIGYHTGFSPVDCIRLKWEEVDLENMVITKHRHKMRNIGGPPVVVPIVPGSDLHKLLLDFKAHPPEYWNDQVEQGFVDPELARRGGLYSLQQLFKVRSRRAGLWVEGRNFGSLRHTFLSRLTNSGCDVALGSKMSGHSNPRAFANYVTPDVDAMRKALVKSMDYAKKKSGLNKTDEVVMPAPDASPPPVSEPASSPQSPVVVEFEGPAAAKPSPESAWEPEPSEPEH